MQQTDVTAYFQDGAPKHSFSVVGNSEELQKLSDRGSSLLLLEPMERDPHNVLGHTIDIVYYSSKQKIFETSY